MPKKGKQEQVAAGEPAAVPYVPVPTSTGGQGGASSSEIPTLGTAPQAPNTLDEPLSKTFQRDILRIFGNVRMVLLPCLIGRQRSTALRNWDLWGPLVFMIGLATLIVSGADHNQEEFPIVFAILVFGALVLTLNIALLGGSIVFFQSLCLIGYCLFPLVLSAIVCLLLPGTGTDEYALWHLLLRFVVVLIGVVWSFWATFPFVSESVNQKRRWLAVYPMLLLYIAIGWMELFST